jgi:hypothetical protein
MIHYLHSDMAVNAANRAADDLDCGETCPCKLAAMRRLFGAFRRKVVRPARAPAEPGLRAPA